MKDNKTLNLIYEIGISILALIASTMAILDILGKISIDSSYVLHRIDIIILLLFTIDYFARLLLSENKNLFFKKNILDLLAIIPFSSIFRILRVSRLFRLLKIAKITKISRLIRLFSFGAKFKNKTKKFIRTNGFIYVLYLSIIVVILGAVSIYFLERGKTMSSFGDAIWWSFVTATTVGYGDISPSTGLGKIVASIIMLVGIGFIGMLTGTIATFFINGVNDSNADNKIENKNIDLSDLDDEKYTEILSYIDYIKKR